ncbi:MAG: hypothetical protein H6587_03520 [Flavobacteriales bacterium]|jgi:hypothetical protein|nr:hypothetical protein [Flavobacteriales bacterium]MCB9363618.1 hypothetical protein [Flavobacteriales bacterium]
MVSLGFLLFFIFFFMAMWCLVFLFTVAVPGAIKLAILNKVAPRFVESLAGDVMDKKED